MSRSRFTFLVTFLITILGLGAAVWIFAQNRVSTTSLRENDPNNPYIYYYSDIEHAFIIERADGTDSRLLAQNVMADEFDIVHSVQWSPSGKWMSWLGRVYAGPGDSPTKAWIIGTDGQTSFELSDSSSRILFLSWSPTQDFVFVIIESNVGLIYRILDVDSRQVLAEQQYLGIGGSRSWSCCFQEDITWSEDGYGVAYPLHGQDFEGIAFMQINGVVRNRYFDERTPLLSFNHHRLATYDWGGTSNPNMLQIEDSITGQSTEFEIDVEYVDRALYDFDLFWNPDLSHALIAEKQCEDTRCEIAAMRLLNWNSGTQQILPENLHVGCDPYDYCEIGSIWSINGEIAALQGVNNQLKLLDVASAELYSVSIDNVHTWYWLNDNDLRIVQGDYQEIYRYDWQTHSTKLLPSVDGQRVFNIWGLQPTQDGKYIGYLGLPDITVQNTETGVQQSWPHHSGTAYGSGPVRGYKWHENGEWFFSGGNTMYSDGVDARAIMIHHIGNPLRRELTLCYNVYGCAGFVSDHALPYLSQGQQKSYTEAPLYTLLHDDAVSGVAWSPDGTYIASYSNSLNIWEISDNEPLLIKRFDTDFICGEHPFSCDVMWEDSSTVILNSYREIEQWNISDGTNIRIAKDNAGYNSYLPLQYDYRVRQSDDRQTYEIVDSQTEAVLATVPTDGSFNTAIWHKNGHAVLINQSGDNSYIGDSQQLFVLNNPAYIFAMDYDPETNLVVGAGAYGRGIIWDLETGEQLKPPNWSGRAVAFSPDGSQLAVAGSDYVTIWDLSEYRQ